MYKVFSALCTVSIYEEEGDGVPEQPLPIVCGLPAGVDKPGPEFGPPEQVSQSDVSQSHVLIIQNCARDLVVEHIETKMLGN